MTWVRLEDNFDENVKVARVGPLGIALWVTGLAYCNRNLTDGFIPWAIARRLLAWEYVEPAGQDGQQKVIRIGVSCGMQGSDVDSERIINLLVDAGLWDIVDGGYQVHDYDQYQPARAQVEAERAHLREVRAEAGRQGGLAKAKQTASKTEATDLANGVAKLQQNASPVPVPVPVPVLPDPKPHKLASLASAREVESEPVKAEKVVKPPPRTQVTEEWLAEMRETYGPRLRDFDESVQFAMNGSYYRGVSDKRAFLEGRLKAAAEREAQQGRGVPRAAGPPTSFRDIDLDERAMAIAGEVMTREQLRAHYGRDRMGRGSKAGGAA